MPRLWTATWVTTVFAAMAHCSFPPPTMPSDGPRAENPSYAPASNTRSKVDRLEQQLAQAVSRMEEMQSHMDQIKGKSEVLGFEIQELRQQAQNQNQDLDARLREIEHVQLADGIRTAPAPAVRPKTPLSSTVDQAIVTTKPSQETPATNTVGIENTIKQMFEDQSWDASIVQLQGWLDNNAKHPKRADAMLALGQGYYEKKDYPRAIQTLQSVVDEFPVSGQACQARYYQGQAFVGLKDNKNAALFFQETVELCPKNPAKEKAQKALQSINA